MTDPWTFLHGWLIDNTDLSTDQLQPTTPLLDAGRLDSLKIMELMMALEAEFGTSVPLEAIVAENFRSGQAIVAMIAGLDAQKG